MVPTDFVEEPDNLEEIFRMIVSPNGFECFSASLITQLLLLNENLVFVLTKKSFSFIVVFISEITLNPIAQMYAVLRWLIVFSFEIFSGITTIFLTKSEFQSRILEKFSFIKC